MNTRLRFIIGLIGICPFVVSMSLADAAEKHSGQSALDFARDVLPILSDHCFSCHGPDEASRQAGLRLDRRDNALKRINGAAAIVPSEPASSEVIRRIRAADIDVVMPPPEALKPLSEAQKDVLERWIAVGAPYAGHWAFTAPPTIGLARSAERQLATERNRSVHSSTG